MVDFTECLSEDVLPVLDKAISEFGTIIEVKTDNGPLFN